MAKASALRQTDLVADPRASLFLWRLPAAAMIAAYLVGDARLMTTLWTGALTHMGLACLANASGCGRLHCYFTGPFFLVGALASALQGSGRVRFGWGRLGVALIGGWLALGYGPEMLWGRYARWATECAPVGQEGACCR